MMINIRLIRMLMCCALAALLSWTPVQAQNTQKNKATENAHAIKVPGRWLTKDEVENLFGAPSNKSSPVGNPPISAWEYPKFYVYFEGDRVLDAFGK